MSSGEEHGHGQQAAGSEEHGQQAAGGEERGQQRGHDDRAAAERSSRSQSQASTSRPRKKRSQTKWPPDVKSAGQVNEEGVPEDPKVNVRLSRVCGLAARQRVPLTLDNFEDLTTAERDDIFKNDIQPYVEYPEDLHEKATRLAMKIISHAWRSYKNK